MVSKEGLNHDITWKYVKEVRAEFYKNRAHRCNGEQDVFQTGTHGEPSSFVTYEDMDISFNMMLELLNVKDNITNEILSLSRKNIEIGGEMFVYLNTCPTTLVLYYQHLMYEKSVSEIFLSILNFNKNTNNGRNRVLSNKVMSSLASTLGFEYNRPTKDMKWTKQHNTTG